MTVASVVPTADGRADLVRLWNPGTRAIRVGFSWGRAAGPDHSNEPAVRGTGFAGTGADLRSDPELGDGPDRAAGRAPLISSRKSERPISLAPLGAPNERTAPTMFAFIAFAAIVGIAPHGPAPRPPADPRLYAGLVWRNVGPFRGGRVSAVSGAIGQPGVFYAGFPAGGVWKTTSAGATWFPVFDAIRSVSSIGAVEVAPSNPDVIYVGTGDMITATTLDQGDGVYRSTDAGKTWRHLGLEATKHIPSILVDPRSPEVVLVAAQGDPIRRTDQRGVFRTTDGGKHWVRTLFVDQETGAQKLARAADVPDVVFTTTVKHFVPPGYPIEKLRSWQFGLAPRTGTAVFKSVDGGVTWRELSGGGLPRLEGRTSIAVAMNTNAERVFLIGNSGLYRSDDGGTTWRQMAADDQRIRNGQSGYDCGVYVDPKNPDLVYTLATSSYVSTDGGKTFTGLKGAPGGDDPQQLWIDPTDGRRMLMGLDQGASVSLDGGATWSSWYNQSTEQLYHVATDNSYPYWIYATQQDASAIRTRSRGNYGAVTMFDWNSVNGWEWGTVLPDPLDDNTVFASGNGIVKISYPSEQWINVSPAVDPAATVRLSNSQPLLWAPWNPRQLIAGLNYVVSTTDRGAHWTRISPDLGIPKGLDSATAAGTPNGLGAIEALAASPVGRGTIWASTSNGLIHLTRDGGRRWMDVSIPGLTDPRRANISGLEASPHHPGTAYAALEYIRLGDHTPHVYRTRDYGKTWTKIIAGLPADEPSGSLTRVIRADPKQPGLLFVGTESGVHVSFDDGDHWHSLALNLPVTSYRDITIKGNDLVVATYGRGIWILDDFSALRQITPEIANRPVHLFAPGLATRVRRNVGSATPLPPEIPHGLNPPDGAILDYYLATKPVGEITIEVQNSTGRVIRRMSSVAEAPVTEAARPPHPNYWLATPAGLPANAGGNRATWDLRYDAPKAFSHSFEINANLGLTPASPEGPLALPGVYTVRLTVDGKPYTQRLTVRNDPRSNATSAALTAQHRLLTNLHTAINAVWDGHLQATALRTALPKAAGTNPPAEVATAAATLTGMLDGLTGTEVAGPTPTFRSVSGKLVNQLMAQENADLAPTPAMAAAFEATCRDLRTVAAAWDRVAGAAAAFNALLARAEIAALPVPAAAWTPTRGGCGGERPRA